MTIALAATDIHSEFLSASGEIITLTNVGATSGNVVLLVMSKATDGALTCNFNGSATPSTYDKTMTLLDSHTENAFASEVWYRVMDGSEGSAIRMTYTTSANGGIIIREFSGVDNASPIDDWAQNTTYASSAIQALPTGTATSTTNGMAVVNATVKFANSWEEANNSWGSAINFEQSSDSVQGGVVAGTIAYSGAGSRSDTLTTTDTGGNAVGWSVLLKEAANAPTLSNISAESIADTTIVPELDITF